VPVEKVLEDAGVSKGEVSEVVLVGGSTRIPKVRPRTAYGHPPPSTTIQPHVTRTSTHHHPPARHTHLLRHHHRHHHVHATCKQLARVTGPGTLTLCSQHV
jgi:hypothetical protein